MNYRTATVLAATDLGEAGTKTIDINIKDIISRLTLRWKVTKSQHGMSAPDYKDISKIELVDGSDVLFSMDGGEAQALNIYDRRCPSMCQGTHMENVGQTSLFGIDFGRKLFDPELAFDPTKFRNPQLKVTWDEDVSDDGVEANELEVLAECFDEKVVSPIGFLMSKEHWGGAVTSAGFEYIDLPTDYPIRKLLVKAYRDNTAAFSVITQAKLDEDNEKRIPFNYTSLEDYATMMQGVWKPVEERIFGYAKSDLALYYYLTPTNYAVIPLMASQSLAEHIAFQLTPIGGKLGPTCETGHIQFLGLAVGYLPNHCFEFPFGDPQDLADWYDVTKLGSLRLRLYKAGEPTSTGGVVLQQLRRY